VREARRNGDGRKAPILRQAVEARFGGNWPRDDQDGSLPANPAIVIHRRVAQRVPRNPPWNAKHPTRSTRRPDGPAARGHSDLGTGDREMSLLRKLLLGLVVALPLVFTGEQAAQARGYRYYYHDPVYRSYYRPYYYSRSYYPRYHYGPRYYYYDGGFYGTPRFHYHDYGWYGGTVHAGPVRVYWR
jgi:hypothetical protein